MSSRTSRFVSTSLLAYALLAAAGCGDESAQEPRGGDEVRSEKQRITTPQVAATDLTTQVEANAQLAFDLYQQLRVEPGNLFYSPHSITLALAMAHGGARANTEQQMASTLHYALPQDRLHPVFNKLDLELQSRGEKAQGADGEPFRLNIVNATWGQRDYSFLPAYLDLLALNYGAGMRLLDFESQPEPSRQTINRWVEEQTEGRIVDLLPPGTVDSMTRLVLTNAIYFNAAWADPFEEKATKDEPFQLLDGSKVTVPMMSGVISATFAKGEDYVAAAIPYDGHELSMVVIVPEEGAFESFEQNLSAQVIDGIVTRLSHAQVTLKLPRFEFDYEAGLAETLLALGMTDAFNAGKADFSGIDGKRWLYISEVRHKAFIKVNEAGTEAAAATVVVMPGSAMPEPATLIADRPFIFLIRDHATGAILFVGRVVNPRA